MTVFGVLSLNFEKGGALQSGTRKKRAGPGTGGSQREKTAQIRRQCGRKDLRRSWNIGADRRLHGRDVRSDFYEICGYQCEAERIGPG